MSTAKAFALAFASPAHDALETRNEYELSGESTPEYCNRINTETEGGPWGGQLLPTLQLLWAGGLADVNEVISEARIFKQILFAKL